MAHAIVYAVNTDFYPLLRIALRSLQGNYPQHPEVLILCIDLPQHLQSRLREEFGAQCIPLQLAPEEIGPLMPQLDSSLNAASFYARLRLFSSTFDDWDSLLFLDADTLVLRPLDPLFEEDEFFIVEDFLFSPEVLFYSSAQEDASKQLEADGMQMPKTQANAGVFLLPKRYRGELEHQRVLYYLQQYASQIRYADQAILNIWMLHHQLRPQLDFDYNMQTNVVLRAPDVDFSSAAILHFTAVPDTRIRLLIMRVLYTARRLGLRGNVLRRVWQFLLLHPRTTRILSRMASLL